MDAYIQGMMDVWIDGWMDRSIDVHLATLNFCFFFNNKKIEHPKITESLHL